MVSKNEPEVLMRSPPTLTARQNSRPGGDEMTTTRIVAGTAALVVMAMQSPLAYAGGQADQTAQTGQVAAIEQPAQAGPLPVAPAASSPAVEAPATEVAQAVPVAPPETAAPQAASRAKASADNGSIQE